MSISMLPPGEEREALSQDDHRGVGGRAQEERTLAHGAWQRVAFVRTCSDSRASVCRTICAKF